MLLTFLHDLNLGEVRRSKLTFRDEVNAVKTLAFLPILLGAGAFSLSAHALETIDLDPRDELSRLDVPHGDGEAGAAFSPAYRRVAARGAAEPDLLPARPVRVDVFDAADMSVFLQHARLAPQPDTDRHDRAAQLLAALAAAGLVARRRLVGR